MLLCSAYIFKAKYICLNMTVPVSGLDCNPVYVDRFR